MPIIIIIIGIVSKGLEGPNLTVSDLTGALLCSVSLLHLSLAMCLSGGHHRLQPIHLPAQDGGLSIIVSSQLWHLERREGVGGLGHD